MQGELVSEVLSLSTGEVKVNTLDVLLLNIDEVGVGEMESLRALVVLLNQEVILEGEVVGEG